MNIGGVTTQEALQDTDKLSKIIKLCYNEDEIISNINNNHSLNWFQKRRLIKQVRLG